MGHTYHQLQFHIVFGTKQRQPWIVPEIQESLYRYITGVVGREGGKLVRIGGVADHVHLLVRLKPNLAVSDLTQVVKGASSRWISSEFEPSFQWQPGYGAFSVSPSKIDAVARYIERQEIHHRSRSFEEEFRWLLEEHGLDP